MPPINPTARIKSTIPTLDLLTEVLESQSAGDVFLHGRDAIGHPAVSVAHAAVLARVAANVAHFWRATRFCACACATKDLCAHAQGNDLHLTLEGVRVGEVDLALRLIYFGETAVEDGEEEAAVKKVLKMLGINLDVIPEADVTVKSDTEEVMEEGEDMGSKTDLWIQETFALSDSEDEDKDNDEDELDEVETVDTDTIQLVETYEEAGNNTIDLDLDPKGKVTGVKVRT